MVFDYTPKVDTPSHTCPLPFLLRFPKDVGRNRTPSKGVHRSLGIVLSVDPSAWREYTRV